MIDTGISLQEINKRGTGNMGEHLGIEFIEIDPDFLKARMPVDHRTTQPLGMLNGGASAALSETVGSMAAYLSVDRDNFYTLGLEIKVNHIRSATGGYVIGTARPAHIGKRTHVWQIETRDEADKLIALSTLTMAVLEVDEKMRGKYRDLFFTS
jgi:1,4-dihydroxy-2-naphthoyl-CoA hydrolase